MVTDRVRTEIMLGINRNEPDFGLSVDDRLCANYVTELEILFKEVEDYGYRVQFAYKSPDRARYYGVIRVIEQVIDTSYNARVQAGCFWHPSAKTKVIN